MANPRLLSTCWRDGAIRKSFFTPICTFLLDGCKPFRNDKNISGKTLFVFVCVSINIEKKMSGQS